MNIWTYQNTFKHIHLQIFVRRKTKFFLGQYHGSIFSFSLNRNSHKQILHAKHTHVHAHTHTEQSYNQIHVKWELTPPYHCQGNTTPRSQPTANNRATHRGWGVFKVMQCQRSGIKEVLSRNILSSMKFNILKEQSFVLLIIIFTKLIFTF